ncbi:sensor histidine kinase [Roseibium aggregatum]|uniref:histidine kinase n=1 Tax=Roseibium aggregatum TaxID=187304 RepID=A0A939EF67_9HYPH|nr:ATP-binding protein [Roseibium aggregatum]MBN9672035.1 hypothetical protein [Roseibium aggregatum]
MGVSLTFRFLLIFLSLFLAFWTLVIAHYYMKNDLSGDEINPSPEKLAAIVNLIEQVPPDERDAVLQAIQSSFLKLEVVPAEKAVPAEDAGELVNDPIGAPYSAVLGERLLHVEISLKGMLREPFWVAIRQVRSMSPPARALSFWIAMEDGTVLIASSNVPLVVTPFGLPAGLGAGIVGTVFAFLAFLLFHREINPLKKLAAAVERIDPAGEKVDLPKFHTTTPEIKTLRRAFDTLQTRLQALTRSRMALIGGIQHDVRSFATRLRLRVEALPDEFERERAIADINDMIGLLDNALLTTKAGFGALDRQMLDLVEWLPPEISDLKSVGLDVTFDSRAAPVEAMILGDRLALRRILTNLIENAVKYGTSAKVTLLRDHETATVQVDDRGPGFNPDEADLLLEPFVRAEPSRARNTGGAGLGLSVAVTLAEAHGGQIELSNHPDGGRASLTVPLYIP